MKQKKWNSGKMEEWNNGRETDRKHLLPTNKSNIPLFQ